MQNSDKQNDISSSRIFALDVFRGITIAGMICVNNPGSEYVYTPFAHSQWNGLTPTDLVFPFFMFIMGVSMYLSLSKSQFTCTRSILVKILKRSLLIWIIGLGLNAFMLFCQKGFLNSDIRILGILPRLAICYGTASLIAITVKYKHIVYIISTLLVGYLLLLLLGNGFDYNESNILSFVDRHILGLNHMYSDNGIDPEGILSTIPSIAHTLIGFCCGKIIKDRNDIHIKIERLFLVGTVLIFLGYFLSFGCPINKKIWSPTYVFATCGLAALLLALLIWLIDVKKYKQWTGFFHVFGMNPLFLYVLSEALAVGLYAVGFQDNGSWISVHKALYNIIHVRSLSPYGASLLFAFILVGFNWFVGYILYKKKIFIKI